MGDLRLPWNNREGILFGCIIAFLSSMLIGGYNVYDGMGYTVDRFGEFVTQFIVIWPFMFIIAFTLSNTIVGWVSGKVVRKFMAPTDSVNTYICFNLIVCVIQMSVILTFVGGLVGQAVGSVLGDAVIDVAELLENWPRIWPRNFCIAFWVEMLIAQPAARRAMVMVHERQISKAGGEGYGN